MMKLKGRITYPFGSKLTHSPPIRRKLTWDCWSSVGKMG